MILIYIQQLIQNMPKNINMPIELDLVLSGGAFNGSYILGCLYYIKELEKQNLVKIKRISGSSIGSILGLLYFSNQLDLFTYFYDDTFKSFKKNKNLSTLMDFKQKLKDKLPLNICDIVKNKLYICFNNIKLCKKYTKNKYNNVDELLEYIIRSCYVPYLIDYNSCYKNKYIDGMLPYLFKKIDNRNILYINVITHDKLFDVINVKNETINLHRILTGIIDIHLFFIKGQNTIMCSYIKKWFVYEYVVYYLSYILEHIIVYIMYFTKKINNVKIVKLLFKELMNYYITQFLV
jgi:hypothetical protein